MKKPSLYYTGGNETCYVCRYGWKPNADFDIRCGLHGRVVRNADCRRCRDWKYKHSEELTVDDGPSS